MTKMIDKIDLLKQGSEEEKEEAKRLEIEM